MSEQEKEEEGEEKGKKKEEGGGGGGGRGGVRICTGDASQGVELIETVGAVLSITTTRGETLSLTGTRRTAAEERALSDLKEGGGKSGMGGSEGEVGVGAGGRYLRAVTRGRHGKVFSIELTEALLTIGGRCRVRLETIGSCGKEEMILKDFR